MHGVEVIAFILRSYRNLSPDFLTRASNSSIAVWASTNGVVEVNLNSTRWAEFINCVPRLHWVDNLEPGPTDMALSPVPVIGEFRSSAGTFMNWGLDVRVDIQPCRVDNVSIFNIVFAQAQSVSEIELIRSLLTIANTFKCVW